jgi:hypothetical protein
VRQYAKRLREVNKTLYYTLKFGLLGGIFLAIFWPY